MNRFILFSAAIVGLTLVGNSRRAFAQDAAANSTPTPSASSVAAPAATPVVAPVAAPAVDQPVSNGATRANTSIVASTLTSTPAMPVHVDIGYRVDVDDTISIGVARHGDVGGTYHIPPDGLLYLPRLITPIDVRQKTSAELVNIITQKLTSEGKLVLRPGQVTVSVIGTRVRRIFVRGNAVRGSDYDLKNGWRVDDLVALMGSVPQPDRVTAELTNPQRPAPVSVDLAAALKNPTDANNLPLQEGDTLTINLPMAKRLIIKGEGPRGEHDFEDAYGLRRALISIGFSPTGATGDLHKAHIIRYAKPGDTSTTATYIPVDLYTLLTQDALPDVPFQDLDTLEIPLSDQWVYVMGQIQGPARKWYMPQDRKTYLIDVFVGAADVTGQAKLGDIEITRQRPDGTYQHESYDFGKFTRTGDPKYNPEILPHDIVYVPTNPTHLDPVGSIWSVWGLYSIAKAINPAW